ncbi:kelch-like protein 12 [Branchiostoma floridae]|uniref:Kelch-like protein 12 n=1 Tax=Branchiostoma floridae TaxID=7739 RepID=A0A9J7NCQ2_BRAFL|nr:kelch-like protein 12 [Branchiostoma floridae]
MNVMHEDHSYSVLDELNKLREQAELTDVVLEVEGISFPCHRAVLASCSPYFRTMFTSGYAEAKQENINIQGVSEVALATILDYAYTGCLQTEPDQVKALMSAGRLLQDHLDVSNCADVLMYADMLGDCDLVKASGRYIASSSEKHAEIDSKCPSTDIKLVYSKSKTQRLGQVRREMQIFPLVPIKALDDFVDDDSSAPCFDPSTGELDAIHIPENLDSYSLTATPDDLYLAGGVRGSTIDQKVSRQKAFYQYNQLLHTWEQRSEMISARVWCGLVYLKGYIYAIGGDYAKGTAERYDPSSDEWTSIPPLPVPMCGSQRRTVTLNDIIYVISKDGCHSFSTTENKWSKIADMLVPPVHPQVVSYQGRIFCMDSYAPSAISSDPTCVEVCNPADGVWKQSGNGKKFAFYASTLMKHDGNLYLITVHFGHDRIFGQPKQHLIDVHQYQADTDSWLFLRDEALKRRLIPALAHFKSGNSVDCLAARMIQRSPRDTSMYEGIEISSDEDSFGSGITDDSQQDLSDQDDSDEENSDND